tara:strand:+ start:304 stop:471 length:168 start_codon:yes stop_codon:yes gene_type:complete
MDGRFNRSFSCEWCKYKAVAVAKEKEKPSKAPVLTHKYCFSFCDLITGSASNTNE